MSRGKWKRRKSSSHSAPRPIEYISHETQITPGTAIRELIKLVKESKANEAKLRKSDDLFFSVWERHRV